MSKARTHYMAPAITSIEKAESDILRGANKLSAALQAYSDRPNVGSLERVRDRFYAMLNLYSRLAFVKAVKRTDLRGAALASHVQRCADDRADALLTWARNYDTASGWSAVRRTVVELKN